MTVVLVFVVLVICWSVFLMLRASVREDGGGEMAGPFTEREVSQARLDLHRLQRDVDLTLARHEQHREAERVKQAIAEALDMEGL